KRYFGRVIGVSPAFARMHSWRWRSGAMFDDTQLAAGAHVAVLGAAASGQLFGPGANPVGQSVVIRGHTYTIVGVTESKVEDQAECIFVPFTSVQKALNISHLQTIT